MFQLSDAMLAVMVFAGGESGKDACQGDSGGPFSYPNPDNNNQHELVREQVLSTKSWPYCATKTRN